MLYHGRNNMIVFNKDKISDVFCDGTEHGCIHKAVEDLLKDLSKVSQQNALYKKYLPVDEKSYIVVGNLQCPNFQTFLKNHDLSVEIQIGQWEYSQIKTFGENNENLLICGSDPRGTMWGIYDFCKKYLGVDPLYYWTDNEPRILEVLELPKLNFVDYPKTYRFRGWFINDEDLLSEWKDGGGTRYAEYKYYQQVVRHDVLEKVLETGLRLKQNLMIPASLLDIENPAEENLVRLVTERGMYVSQHHIEPLGVSHFSWDSYWNKQNKSVSASYVTQKEHYVEIWTHYVKKWAKYENVIWQLGLRGRADRPVWFTDKNVSPSMEERGRLISTAIHEQASIVEQVLGHKDFLSTATLWAEMSELHHSGYLTFPEHTVVIFADKGSRQMWGEDFYKVERKKDVKYGVYYHVAYWCDGPHLVQGTPLEKIYYNYKQAVEKEDTLYSILNVTNIREVVLGIQAVADMTWDAKSFQLENWLLNFTELEFGKEKAEAVAKIYKNFYSAYASLDNNRLDGSMLFIDGMVRIVGMNIISLFKGGEVWREVLYNSYIQDFISMPLYVERFKKITKDALLRFKAVYQQAMELIIDLTDERKTFFMDNVIVQLEIIIGLHTWLDFLFNAAEEYCGANDRNKVEADLNEAALAINKILSIRTKMEHGKWSGWYKGDKKMNLVHVLKETIEVKEFILR